MSELKYRWATLADGVFLEALMHEARTELLLPYLGPDGVAASAKIMGLDTQLLADGTMLVAESDGRIVACGAWSMRATLYGGDGAAVLREDRLLMPGVDPARIRAMYTKPSYARRGLGRSILATCEAAAASAGFDTATLMATKAGRPLYKSAGYEVVEETRTTVDGVTLTLSLMSKSLAR